MRAGDGVSPEGAVADVSRDRQDAPARFGAQIELIGVQALTDGAAASRSSRDPSYRRHPAASGRQGGKQGPH